MTSPAASAGAYAKIRCTLSQPTPAWPRQTSRCQDSENTKRDADKMPHWAGGIGRPAPQPLPGYADRPIPSQLDNMAEMDKEHILNEIRRTAKENGGSPLGHARFQQQTGIKDTDWFGRYWARWGGALREAGFLPNSLQGPYAEDLLLERFVKLISELGRFPGLGDLRLKRHQDPTFPSHNTFNRFGSKRRFVAKILEYCRSRDGFDDVVSLLGADTARSGEPRQRREVPDVIEVGFVYLLKSGRYFKISKTNAQGRRERELAIQLPEKARTVHVIKTDDPAGIEVYWHTRFAAKRRHGEWFEVDATDISAFKRRKFM